MSIESYPSPNGVLTSLIWRKTMSGGETSLSGYDSASQALSYTPGQEQVYLNGILLVRGDDYTATNGTSITGLSALSASDFVQVNCYNNFSVASVPAASLTGTVTNAQLANSAITINGSAISLGGTVTLAGDIESVTAGTGLTGGGNSGAVTLSLDTTSVISPTIVNAKGDILTASADNTPAILSLGNSGESIVADSAATTGLRYSATPSASNPILNSAFQIWQRGTSIAGSASVSNYTADRWLGYTAATSTFSRQATGDTTNLPNIQYAMRVQRTAGGTGTDHFYLVYSQESVNSIPYAGKSVTISFYARKGANFNEGTAGFSLVVGTGTGTDQNFLSGYTGSVTALNQPLTLTTTWVRYSYNLNIGATATELGFFFNHRASATAAGAADYYEVTGVQIDVGSVALPFRTNGGTIQGELAACQRYFQKSFQYSTAPANNASDVAGAISFARQATSGSVEPQVLIVWKVQMRIAPSVTLYNLYSGTAGQWSDGTTTGANARCFNISDSAAPIDNTDVTLAVANASIHYAASAEL